MKFFDLFSGIGGFHLGLERAGHECVGACENDTHARSIYAKHFPKTKIWKDAKKIKPQELPDFDVLAFGSPCPAFSIAGKRLAFAESRGTLFYEGIRIAKQKRPRLILFENVEGILSAGFAIGTGFFEDNEKDTKGEITQDLHRVKNGPPGRWTEIKINVQKGECFLRVLGALDEIGYDAEWQVLNSKYFVPQNRPRLYLVGYLRDGPRSQIFPVGGGGPEPTGIRGKKRGGRSRVRSDRPAGAVCANYGKKGRTQTMIAESKLEKVVDGSQRATVYDSKGLAPTIVSGTHGYAMGYISEPELKKLVDGREAERVYDPDGISSTVKASGGGMGGKSGLYFMSHTKANMKKRHQVRDTSWTLDTSGSKMAVDDTKRIRRLTPMECERLQGFPDNWTAGHKDGERYKCAGNAVTVDVVEFIGRRLK